MFKTSKISVVFPAFNEEPNIAKAIKDFRNLKIIDEIIVVDNNSSDRTSKIATLKKARVIIETKQGYGYALMRGMKEAKGDYIVLCEPDGTFAATDLFQLLSKIENYDMIMGTRTDKKYISKKANMGGMLRFGNVALAKLIQLLYRPSLNITDCGCTFRIIKRNMVKKLLPKLEVGGSYFLAELLLVSLTLDLKVLEVPVRYKKRIGESKITGSLKKSIIVGMQMLKLTLTKRFA